MKKLIMTTVAAFGFAVCAKADVLNSTGFEGYGSNSFKVNATDTGATEGDQFWTGDGSADFTQTVLKTYAAEIEKPANVPDAFTNAANTTFLSVDTGNAVMYRRAVANPTETINLSSAGPVFFDADVKFTASETPVVPLEGDKLLVWLKGDETTTNLVVTANVTEDEGETWTNTNFEVDGAYAADTWYRLTVKADKKTVGEKEVAYFNVYINGVKVAAKDTQTTDFYSLVTSGTEKTKLEAAGFQGTGALDNVVWTTTDPFPPVETTFPMTLTVEDEDAATDMALYVQDAAVTNEFTSGVAVDVLKETTMITIVVGVFDGYEVTDFTKGDSYENNDGDPCTYYTKDVAVTPEMLAEGYALTLTVVADGGEEATDISTAVVVLSADSIKVGEACPTVTSVTVSEVPLALGTDYTVEYPDVSTEGEKTITLTGIGKYNGTATATFTVTAAEPTTVVTPTAAEIESGKITVTEETTAIKVGGVDVSIDAFDVVGTTATVKAPVVADSAAEEDDAFVIDDEKNEVTINVNPVEGLFYGVSAATDLNALARPAALTQYTGSNKAAIFTVTKPEGTAAFFKVYVDIKE